MSIRNTIINSMWAGGALRDASSFNRHLADPRNVQLAILRRLLRQNRDTAFGKEHGFGRIAGYDDYRGRVPVRTYEELHPWIERTMNGEANVLTREGVLLFEPTGGSTTGSKLIPYTRSLKREFQRAVAPWIVDIFKTLPAAMKGRSYWSITPIAAGQSCTPGGIPIGFEDDTGYLGRVGNLVKQVFAMPPEIKLVRDAETFWYATSYFLLRADDLAIISVWNPSFLKLIVETIDRNLENLVRDLRDGLPTRYVAAWPTSVRRRIKAAPARAKAVEAAFAGDASHRFTRSWQRLQLVSCWADGSSRYAAEDIASYFPGVRVQAKGLVATEGIISLPQFSVQGHVPAYTAHLLEFLDENGQARLLDEIEKDETYTVVMTTGGGLSRYNLRDKVQVTGKHKGLPLIRFLGRDAVCDMVGEKLNETHVCRVIEVALGVLRIRASFALLAPTSGGGEVYYVLYLQLKDRLSDVGIDRLAGRVEDGLNDNFHYEYARKIGQLSKLRVFVIDRDANEAFLERCTDEGRRLGDIKHAFLDQRADWNDHFEGRFVGGKATSDRQVRSMGE
jgi:hypothetical protein